MEMGRIYYSIILNKHYLINVCTKSQIFFNIVILFFFIIKLVFITQKFGCNKYFIPNYLKLTILIL